jgi:hypothetical protein
MPGGACAETLDVLSEAVADTGPTCVHAGVSAVGTARATACGADLTGWHNNAR